MYNYNATMIKVVDGDTMDFEVNLGFGIKNSIRVRLLGIDTPEIFHPSNEAELIHGREARQFVFDNFVGRKGELRTHKDRTGKYGRFLAEFIIVKDGNPFHLTQALIDNGFEKKKLYSIR